MTYNTRVDRSASSAMALHQARFGAQGAAFQAPGRVNLIGEHTDTSLGYVMPAALELRTISILSPRTDSIANLYSADFDKQTRIDLEVLPDAPRGEWSDYPVAALWSLAQRGIRCGGFEMTLTGDIPIGAGLSSSASVEVAVATAVLAHAGVTLPGAEIAKLCQNAENRFIGAQSGIMDPFASVCGVAGHAILLDCRSLEFEPLPLPETVVLVVANSMVKHSLSGDDSYNRRRRQVEEGARILQKDHPEIQTLRDANEELLRSYEDRMPAEVFRRCLHVVTENRRVLRASEALRLHDFSAFGQWMLDAHASMRDNYEASCPETDTLVSLAMEQPGCFGARITGAGFGGCTVNLVEAGAVEGFVKNLRAGYQKMMGIEADIYLSRASAGAGPL